MTIRKIKTDELATNPNNHDNSVMSKMKTTSKGNNGEAINETNNVYHERIKPQQNYSPRNLSSYRREGDRGETATKPNKLSVIHVGLLYITVALG